MFFVTVIIVFPFNNEKNEIKRAINRLHASVIIIIIILLKIMVLFTIR